MRILHLADPAKGRTGPTTFALLNAALGRLQGIDTSTWLFGSSQLLASARAAGVASPQFVSTPLGDPLLQLFKLRSILSQSPRHDVVHCWSPRSFYATRVLSPRSAVILHVTRPLQPPEVRQARAALASHADRCIVLCISATLRHHLLTQGVPARNTLVLPPGIDLSMHQPGVRPSLRESWGITDPGIRLVGLLADPAHAADAYKASMCIGLDQEIKITRAGPAGVPQFHLLIHPHQTRLSAATTMNLNVRDESLFHQDGRVDCPWLTLPGCDAVLAFGQHTAGLSLFHAMAAGVPIVAEATHWNCEALEDRHNALLSRPGWTQGLSHNLLQLMDHPDLAWKLKENARQDIYSTFSRSTYCTRLSRVYHALADGKLPSQTEVTPDLAPAA